MRKSIYGIHDAGGAHLLHENVTGDRTSGWVVDTVAVGLDGGRDARTDYSELADAQIDVIVRINNGYGSTGTLPMIHEYERFASSCAQYVARTQSVTRWIIGNEPNHENEWPEDGWIAAGDYARAFKLCRTAIRSLDGHENDEVIVAAVAPWNMQTGIDPISYFGTILKVVGPGNLDGIALHAYTHGADPSFVASDAVHPEGWRWHFRCYQDFMHAIPAGMTSLPVYITETDQGDEAWADVNDGWVQEMYAEVDRWNQVAGNQKIHCSCLYRWEDYDRWSIKNKIGVQDDLIAAIRNGYTVPEQVETNVMSHVKTNGYQDWSTPDDLMEALESKFGAFDLDVCATDDNAKAENYITPANNGLKVDWWEYGVKSRLAFCNPPYGQTEVWLTKALDERANGVTTVCVLRASTDTAWWHELAMKGSIYLLRGRVAFDPPEGVENKKRPGHATAIVVFGPGWPEGAIQGWDWRKDLEDD